MSLCLLGLSNFKALHLRVLRESLLSVVRLYFNIEPFDFCCREADTKYYYLSELVGETLNILCDSLFLPKMLKSFFFIR